jgi:hypothetical protein
MDSVSRQKLLLSDNMAKLHNLFESIGEIHRRESSASQQFCRTLNIFFRDVLPLSVAPLPVTVNDHFDNVSSNHVGVNRHFVDAKCLFGLVTVLPDGVTLWPAAARLFPVYVGLFPLTVK